MIGVKCFGNKNMHMLPMPKPSDGAHVEPLHATSLPSLNRKLALFVLVSL